MEEFTAEKLSRTDYEHTSSASRGTPDTGDVDEDRSSSSEDENESDSEMTSTEMNTEEIEENETNGEQNEEKELETEITNFEKNSSSSLTIKKESMIEDDSDVKPAHSYIALIAMAILSNSSKKMILGDIYQYISENFPYYRNKDKSWRNSIRHNLSLNECFIKAGRSENGKGNYWAIHPANLEDFANGDFRRRRARRRVRKSNALKYSGGVGYPYLRSFASYSPYSSYLSHRAEDLTRLYSGYSSGYLPPTTRKSFAIDDIISSSPHSQYPAVQALSSYDHLNASAMYPALPNTTRTTSTASVNSPCSAALSFSADRPCSGLYSSPLSAFSCLSNLSGYNGRAERKESWQDTLCKLQEQLRKTTHKS